MNSKQINFNDKQFEYVNAIEIKELNANYLIGKYVGTNNSRILCFVNDGVNYIIDSSKRTDEEKEVLNRYFAFADGVEKFKQALLNGEIVSLYNEMPDVINANYEDVSLKNVEIKTEEVTPKIEENISQIEEVKTEEINNNESITNEEIIDDNENIEISSNVDLEPIVISSTKVEITSPNAISKEMKKISFEKIDSLMAGLQAEIERYYDLINGVVNNG